MILVKDSAPDSSSLGATNGLAQFAMVRPYVLNQIPYPATYAFSFCFCQCFARAFSPAFASSIFALSAGSSFVVMRYFWVVVMIGISLFGTTFSRKIAEGRHLS